MIITPDKSIAGQVAVVAGRLETQFPSKLVLISNHVIYADWLYLWWVAYTSKMHGAMYIFLKDSLKWIPVLGWGMQLFGFIFLSRKWANDKERLEYRLSKLAKEDPMWLLIFPEGTNFSANQVAKTLAYSKKRDIVPPKHLLLPHTTGLRASLSAVDVPIYDITLAYEGVEPEEFAQDFYTLTSLYLEGNPPPAVHMYVRKLERPPLDELGFDNWLREKWTEKDKLLDHFYKKGKFPGDSYEADVKLRSPVEILEIFSVVLSVGLIVRLFW